MTQNIAKFIRDRKVKEFMEQWEKVYTDVFYLAEVAEKRATEYMRERIKQRTKEIEEPSFHIVRFRNAPTHTPDS